MCPHRNNNHIWTKNRSTYPRPKSHKKTTYSNLSFERNLGCRMAGVRRGAGSEGTRTKTPRPAPSNQHINVALMYDFRELGQESKRITTDLSVCTARPVGCSPAQSKGRPGETRISPDRRLLCIWDGIMLCRLAGIINHSPNTSHQHLLLHHHAHS